MTDRNLWVVGGVKIKPCGCYAHTLWHQVEPGISCTFTIKHWPLSLPSNSGNNNNGRRLLNAY